MRHALKTVRLSPSRPVPERVRQLLNRVYDSWQAVGARCLNNLAAKLMLALFLRHRGCDLLSRDEAKTLSQDTEAAAVSTKVWRWSNVC
ncbi:hypothetical protein [Enterobacter phage 01_vB_Eclo_IJM]|nr:hypothetical protein [Enterobacter phage 01_vB_Eclo_IJM]